MPAAENAARTDPRERLSDLALRLLGVTGFALLTALSGQDWLAIPLPPDGVPMTLQTLAVILAAMSLGPRLGAASLGLYLLVGVLGAGVFAEGSKGLGAILGQTGGYLLGFLACQPVIGWCVKRRDGTLRRWPGVLAGALAGHAVIFGLGVPWLAVVNGFGPARALEGGFYPFIPGTILKTALAVVIGVHAAPWSHRRGWW